MLPDAEALDTVYPQLPTHSEEIVRLYCIGQCRSEAAVGSYLGPSHDRRSCVMLCSGASVTPFLWAVYMEA